jgi:3-hydroxyisobutyrate dehydrogenase-like beta-hydroxyacid dehydrogenase
MRAGFIGLGDQGTPMARRLAAAGVPTTVWARRPAVAAELTRHGARPAGTAAELGAASDVVGICVFDAGGVAEVLFGDEGVLSGMKSGGVIAVHTTMSPEQIKSIAGRAAARGVTVLDAPVSGGAQAVEAGELFVMLAGPASAVDIALPVLQTYAGRIVRLGAVGSAQAAKLINNALFAAQVRLVLDALRLADEHGLDDAFLDVLRGGSARSFAAEVVAGIGSAAGLAQGRLATTIRKDVALLEETFGVQGDDSALLQTARELLPVIVAGAGGTERQPVAAVGSSDNKGAKQA